MNDSLILAEKPEGLNTHRATPTVPGFCEILSKQLGQELKICHRLDKQTSGAMVFAKDRKMAAELTQLFTQHQVQKEYLFVTDKDSKKSEFEYESFISVDNKGTHSDATQNPNAKTRFQKIDSKDGFSLWRAWPKTGKTHQIRLHAQDNGIPILGDIDFGGAPFPRVMLHAEKIGFRLKDQEILHTSQPPEMFIKPELCQNHILCQWLSGIDRRLKLYPNLNSLRLLHTDGGDLRCDRLSEVYWFSYYGENKEAIWLDFLTLLEALKISKWYFRHMPNRGDNATEKNFDLSPTMPATWEIEENSARFLLSHERGTSAGIFLDQRQNRQWLGSVCRTKAVLNLFSYTGAFSVIAAKAGARQVVSVDTSAKYNEWAKENFKLNNLSLDKHEFWSSDAIGYLKGAAKHQRQFDIIICDPPSFGRSKTGAFRLEKQWRELLEKMAKLLRPNGLILFSTNFEKWSHEEFSKHLSQEGKKHQLKVSKAPIADFDFEFPGENPTLKTVLLERY
jgi:23S rRNA (cytosine1962-C5)-methyltransferase